MAEVKRIAVLVSVGKHPASGTARYSRNDAAALGVGLRLAGPALDVIHAGDVNEPALSDYLALGAARIDVLCTAPDEDIVPALAERLRGFDLILCGMRTESGAQSGMLPYLLASALRRPVIGNVIDIKPASGRVELLQFLPKGRRRRVALDLPAVVAIHPLAPISVRYAYAARCAGRLQGVQPTAAGQRGQHGEAAWRAGPVTGKPRKLAAAEKRSGHARMMSATVTESRGGQVVSQGTTTDKARAVLAYLRQHGLIDF